MKTEHLLPLARWTWIVVLAAGWPAGAGADDRLQQLEQRLAAQGLFPQATRLSFDRPISAADRALLEAAGAELLEALPPHGLLVRLPAGMRAIEGLAARITAWPLAAKLSPELRALAAGAPLPGGSIDLKAVTFLNRPVAGPASAVRELVAPRARFEAVSDAAGRGHLWLRVAPERLIEVIERLAGHPDVLWVERLLPLEFKNDNSSWLIQSGKQEQGRTVWQRGLTGWGQVVGVADSGLDADACQFRYGPDRAEVTLATDAYQPPAAAVLAPENKVIAYYVMARADAYDDASGGFHGTHTAGDMAGDNYLNLATATAAGHDPQDGMAPGAQIVFQDIGADDGSLMGLFGVSMYDLLLQAYDTGARVHNNSYGSAMTSVAYDSDSASIDQATWQLNDLLVVFAAGNSGADQQGNLQPRSLGGTGSTAKNSLVVGGSGPVELSFYGSTFRLENDLLFFSSQGPTADNRLKPDLVAPGMVFSATSDPATTIDLGCCDIYDSNKRVSNNDDDNCNVDSSSPTFGTSFSSPIATGAAALVRQYYTDGFWRRGVADPEAGFAPTNALLKASLIAGAKPLSGVIIGMGTSDPLTQPPSFTQGWGRVHLEDALHLEGDQRLSLLLEDIPNPTPDNPMLSAALGPYALAADPLVTGQERSWTLPVARPERIMKVVLVWSDPAAAPGAEPALVNNLDLELLAPNDDLYLGNREYDGLGFSQPAWQPGRDSINNVEVITLRSPQAGWHQVRVIGQAIDGNGQVGSDAQGFSLVVAGEFEAPVPLSLEPDRAAPGETLTQVRLSGENFAPGMHLELGTGIAIEGLVVSDPHTATIARLTVAAEATPGPRNATVELWQVLTGSGQALFEVTQKGCSCGHRSAPTPAGIGLLLLGIGLALRRRRS